MMWLGGAAIFGALFILVMLALPKNRVSRKRLGIEREKTSLGRSMDGFLERQGKRQALASALTLADMTTEPGQLALWVLIASILLAILGLLISPVLLIVGLVVPYLVARTVVGSKGRKRQEKFGEQLSDALQLLVASLRSGYGLTQALDSVATEAEEPIRSEFERALVETRMGRTLPDAIRAMAARMRNDDLEWVVGAIEINRDTGGNLAEILENVSGTIRERQHMQRKIHTITSEGRMSARILTALPIGLFLYQWQFSDDFDVLLHGAGLMALVGCGVLMVIGWLWIKRIVTIKI